MMPILEFIDDIWLFMFIGFAVFLWYTSRPPQKKPTPAGKINPEDYPEQIVSLAQAVHAQMNADAAELRGASQRLNVAHDSFTKGESVALTQLKAEFAAFRTTVATLSKENSAQARTTEAIIKNAGDYAAKQITNAVNNVNSKKAFEQAANINNVAAVSLMQHKDDRKEIAQLKNQVAALSKKLTAARKTIEKQHTTIQVLKKDQPKVKREKKEETESEPAEGVYKHTSGVMPIDFAGTGEDVDNPGQ